MLGIAVLISLAASPPASAGYDPFALPDGSGPRTVLEAGDLWQHD